MTTYLVDTNVLLRSCDPPSPSYTAAYETVAQLIEFGHRVCITSQNVIEFWAVATRPVSANGLGWDVAKTKSEVDLILGRFPLLVDTPEIFACWSQLVSTLAITGKRVHDARLVAVMLVHRLQHLVTFNIDDFKVYSGLTLVHPEHVNQRPRF